MPDDDVLAVAYVRVSSREQAREGLSLDDQKKRLAAEIQRREWRFGGYVLDVETGKTHRKRRPQFDGLIDSLNRGEYGALVVTRLDRIARSVVHFATVLDASHRHGWKLVMLDPAVDTTTPYGRATAQMAGVWAELEGALISQRTREALEHARARGTFRPGEHLRYTDEAVIKRIVRWSQQGMGGDRIADRLTIEGVPSPGGGDAWQGKTVRRIINRERQH